MALAKSAKRSESQQEPMADIALPVRSANGLAGPLPPNIGFEGLLLRKRR